MFCNNCGQKNKEVSKYCTGCGAKLSSGKLSKFDPEDLKKRWPGRYDNWKFELNGKNEWVGYFKKNIGVIVSTKDKDGNEIPSLKLRNAVSTGGFGLNAAFLGYKNLDKNKSDYLD